jgi:hypothetical protein
LCRSARQHIAAELCTGEVNTEVSSVAGRTSAERAVDAAGSNQQATVAGSSFFKSE